MTAIKINLTTDVRSDATFEGTVIPSGVSEYKFTGRITATCLLHRENTSFSNIVRVGHGDSSKGLEYVEVAFDRQRGKTYMVDTSHKTLEISGQGQRSSNGTVDFSLGFNEGVNGEFKDGPWQNFSVG